MPLPHTPLPARAGLGVSQQWLQAAPDVPAALAYAAPLAALAFWGVTRADSIAGFREMRAVFKAALIPQLRGVGFMVSCAGGAAGGLLD